MVASSEAPPDDDVVEDPIAARASLPVDLVAFLRRLQKQHAPLCPSCGRRKIEDKQTGWCRPCAESHRQRERKRKLEWWERNADGECPLCGKALKDLRRHLRKVHRMK